MPSRKKDKQAAQNGEDVVDATSVLPKLPDVNDQDAEDDPEWVKELQRPASIKEDMNEMSRRKRVREVLESKPFLSELESLIKHERSHGREEQANNLKGIGDCMDTILPHQQLSHAGPLGLIGGSSIKPVADLRDAGVAPKYGTAERILRNKFASLFRLIDLFQWCQAGSQTHVTLRITQDTENILINPHGVLYHELTASSLVTVDFAGTIVDSGSRGGGIDRVAYCLHSAVHSFRPDLRCVLHLYTPVVGAVAAMKCGLLPISPEAIAVGPVSYHDFAIASPEDWTDESNEAFIRALGPNNKVLLLRNQGFIACGHNIEDAFHITRLLVQACETQVVFLASKGFLVCGDSIEQTANLTTALITACELQVRAARAGIENLHIPTEEQRQVLYEQHRRQQQTVPQNTGDGPKWRPGEVEWEAWMRVLDNAGFRTGHIYRQPMLKSKTVPAQSDVEIPPAITAYGSSENQSAEPLSPHKLAAMRANQEKIRWLNSPTVYQRVETEETGTAEPKKVIKWQESSNPEDATDQTSPAHGNVIKIESAHQFVPLDSDKREFKQKQREIKMARQKDAKTAGPQSHVLESDQWDEATKVQDAYASGTGDHIVVVGAVSQGIIQRDQQHNAQLYRQRYCPNPFANVTDDDIEAYKRTVAAGGIVPDAPSSPMSTESCSIMQMKKSQSRGSQGKTLETTFDGKHEPHTEFVDRPHASGSTSRPKPGMFIHPSPIQYFRRTASDRFGRHSAGENTRASEMSNGRGAASDEEGESVQKKDSKKKKNSLSSFFKRSRSKQKSVDDKLVEEAAAS